MILGVHLQLSVDILFLLLLVPLDVIHLHRIIFVRLVRPLDELFERSRTRERRGLAHLHGQLDGFVWARLEVAEAEDCALEYGFRDFDVGSLAFVEGFSGGAYPT